MLWCAYGRHCCSHLCFLTVEWQYSSDGSQAIAFSQWLGYLRGDGRTVSRTRHNWQRVETKHVYLRTASCVWNQYILARANHNEAMYILSWSPTNAIKECRLLESTSCSCMKMKDFDSHIVMKGKGYQSKDIHPLQHFKLKACVTIFSRFMLLHHAIIYCCCSLIKKHLLQEFKDSFLMLNIRTATAYD